ncbi:cyclic nucleotide-binding domain-containing protein [Solicola gregarius]|uniref:Cyclic nucleotide-binding domain-containing protein n=1 Tax=Solicola gregarius TaxID=2908642 RepID=A0AA46TKQ9_9ACTN|nr:cyclic nucleotide-binding domain-containing protein [Solicola gregarius]UYM07102.1 cyclic nucleotide-binding domain-containing protein [Solicola gregarius]
MPILKRPERIKELPRFRGVSDAHMNQIAAAGSIVTVPERWSMIIEGSPPDQVYLIMAGQVVVRRQGEEIARLSPGDIVGEMSLHEHRLRTATVTAETPLELLHLTREAFGRLYDEVPDFRDAVDATVAERLDSD